MVADMGVRDEKTNLTLWRLSMPNPSNVFVTALRPFVVGSIACSVKGGIITCSIIWHAGLALLMAASPLMRDESCLCVPCGSIVVGHSLSASKLMAPHTGSYLGSLIAQKFLPICTQTAKRSQENMVGTRHFIDFLFQRFIFLSQLHRYRCFSVAFSSIICTIHPPRGLCCPVWASHFEKVDP